MGELKHTSKAPFHVWPNLNPVRTVGATYEGFAPYAQTDYLSRDDLLDMMLSVEVIDPRGRFLSGSYHHSSAEGLCTLILYRSPFAAGSTFRFRWNAFSGSYFALR
jgi:hypothetical protein